MKKKWLTLVFNLIILFLFSCRSTLFQEQKVKKIAIHSFTGKGEHRESTTWLYIKDIADGKFSGYYLQTSSNMTDIKNAHFIYYKMRPVKFEEEYASGEKIQLVKPGQLPDDVLQHQAELEALYEYASSTSK